jgi:hypothetical protein
MSTVVAPLPSGSGVAAIAEHRPRHDPDARQQQGEEEARPDDSGADQQRQQRPPAHRQGGVALPVADEPAVPPETLFAAALLANDVGRRTPSPDEMRLRTSHGWTPPESPLKLKDKLI